MNGLKHPITGALYEQDGEGHVRVTHKGRSGLFRRDGSWVSGELEEADPQLCNWVGGPIYGNHRVTASVKD
jgi:hypothetical protein